MQELTKTLKTAWVNVYLKSHIMNTKFLVCNELEFQGSVVPFKISVYSWLLDESQGHTISEVCLEHSINFFSLYTAALKHHILFF
jgi:predicted DNA-binding transcriptional regulator